MSNRKTFVDTAKKYLGCKESDGTHKKIIDIYNSRTPRPRGYKVKYTDAWCATFVSAVSIECGYVDIIPPECGCGEQINLFKNIGAWQEKDNYVPKSGDVIYYDWGDNGVGDNTGWSDHVGIVESVKDGIITVIEGNKNDAVERRTISVDGRYIRGYGVPKYTEEDKPVADKKPAIKLPSLKNYTGVSIVDGLKSVGYNSSFESRKELWYLIGNTETYRGTAKQNLSLIKYLRGV